MLEKFLYPGPRDNRINDGVREFCLNEHLDEGVLRISVNRSVRAIKRIAGKPIKGITSAIDAGIQWNKMQA